VGPAAIAFAISGPDSDIVLSNIQGYTGVLKDDDLLIVVDYDIPYAALPTEPVTDAYVARFLRDTTDLNSTEIFRFNDKGYNTGIFSFYWTAAQRSTDSVEHGNANSENYLIRLNGKPGVFPGAIPSQQSGAITWRTRLQLRQDIIDRATALDIEADWTDNSQDLFTTGDQNLFTADGAAYFATAIPRLSTMETSLFTSAVASLPPITRVPAESYRKDLDDYWKGTFIADRTEPIATSWGVDVIIVRSVLAMFVMFIIVFVVGMFVTRTGTPKGMEFGLMTLTVTTPLAAAVNFLALPFVLVCGLLGATGIAWALFGHK